MKSIKMILRFVTVGVAVCILSIGASAQNQPPSIVAITHAKIFTLSGSPIEDGTLVIRDCKIAAVGASVEVPAGMPKSSTPKVYKFIQGLFDPITQMGLERDQRCALQSIPLETGAYNPDVVAATVVSPSSEHIAVTRASGITEVLAVPDSGGFDGGGSRGVIGGQASAIHLAGWTINEMTIKKSVAMVISWPQMETRSFDFATFSIKNKPFSEAKQDYEKQVNELADYLDRARHYAQAMGHGGPADYQRDLKTGKPSHRMFTVRGQLLLLFFANRARDIRNAVEFCDKQKLKMILAKWRASVPREGPAPLKRNSGDPASHAHSSF